MEPSPQDIQELRTKFLQRVTDENKDFHPKDLAKATNDEKWLRRFIAHTEGNVKEALNMMMETCEWRKNHKVNDINENNVNRDYINEGGVFLFGRDKDNRLLLIFNCRKHVKGQRDSEELKRIIIYWMERAERMDKGEPVTIFFDMADTGLSNMDMEYIKYIISLFKQYYPYFLNYILIFEMPWVMNAAFKIIKSWLPSAAVQRIKFVDKKSLKEYVDSSQALPSWGGESGYEFVFIPDNAEGKTEENKKKIIDQVHFADGPDSPSSPYSSHAESKIDDSSNTRLVLTPPDTICFIQEGVELSGNLTITNVSSSSVIYKVKTTSPEKFRVRPSFGQLAPGGHTVVNVVLLSGYLGSSILRDKFLVMAYAIEHESNSPDLNEIWKVNSTDTKKLEEHKLRCRVPALQPSSLNGAPGSSLQPSGSHTSEIEQKMSQLLLTMNHMTEVNSKLQSNVLFIQSLMLLTIFLVIALGILIYLNGDPTERGQCHSNLLSESPLIPDK